MGIRPLRYCTFSYNRYGAIITRCVYVCVFNTNTGAHGEYGKEEER